MRPTPKLAHLALPALRLQPDARLVALSRQGHERAFEEIVRRYRSALVSYAGTVVPRDRAEDVVQSSLAKAHGALSGSDGVTRLRPWLYAIVRNTALNDLRHERQHEPLPDGLDGVPQPDQVAERREELAALVGALGSLPHAQREAIVKRELEGLSHPEIAALLGTSQGAVRQLIFRARTALRDAAGALIPLPVLRFLCAADGVRAGTAGAGAGAAALGAAGGGGGGVAAKVGAGLAVAALAAGSGVALHERGGSGESDRAVAAVQGSDGAGGETDSSRGPGVTGSAKDGSAGAGGGTDDRDSGDGRGGSNVDDNGGGSSGPGGGGGSGSGSSEGEHPDSDLGSDDGPSGPGDGDEGIEEDQSGPGGGGDDFEEDHSGPGGGGDEELVDDHSGPGGGGDGDLEDDHGGPGGGGGDDLDAEIEDVAEVLEHHGGKGSGDSAKSSSDSEESSED